MIQKVINRGGRTNRFIGQLAAEKKKTVAASCLVAVMVIMWVKVLTKQAPEAAEAAFTTEQLNVEDVPDRQSNVSFIELPRIAGRNDVITRDFFTSDNWRHFHNKKGQNLTVIEEVNIVSKNGNEEVIRKVAEKLKLEAIVVLSSKPRAFINNKVLSVGDKVLIRDGVDTYECEVIEIEEENKVVIKCREAEVTLKLTQVSD